MADASPPTGVIRFGVFEVDLRSGELRKNALKVRLQDQPFRLLRILLDHPGEVVTREELQRTIWPSDTFVDFDRGLNNAVKRLREALGDTADTPRYIETLPRRGYRFLVPVQPGDDVALHATPVPPPALVESRGVGASGGAPEISPLPAAATAGVAPRHRRSAIIWALAAIALVIGLSALGVVSNAGGLRDRLFVRSVPPVAAPSIHSLAVIPLANLSSDPAQENLADGMTDALITELAQIRSVRVISRTSVMRYKKTLKTLPEISRELNVDGIVEGTIQRSGDRVRITVHLIDASDKDLWASTYERSLADVFALERDVATEITRTVRAELTSDGQPVAPQPRPVNIAALDAYLQGKHHLNSVESGPSDEERKKAAPYFQHAVDLDPTFAQAWRGLAKAHCYLLLPRSEEDEAIIRKAAQRAKDLDSQEPSLDCNVADEKSDDGDWAGAEQEYRKCLAEDPNDVNLHSTFADFLDSRGRFDEGSREHLIVRQLDPVPSDPARVVNLAANLESHGDRDRAIELMVHLLDSHPAYGFPHHLLSDWYRDKHMYRESIEELGRFATSYGYPEIEPLLRRAFAAAGYTGALRRYVQELEQLHQTKRLYAPTYLATRYLQLGDMDRAFYWLREAYTFRKSHRSQCSTDFSPVHELREMKKDPRYSSDPRFLDLLRRIGFQQ